MLKDESFNKVFIGSGLTAELFLNALIRHKGESPDDFYILSKNKERCEELAYKYQIRATTNFHAFISKAKVVVLAVDLPDLDGIPALVNLIRGQVPPDALINSVTPRLKIAKIEEYFPNHPVMRLSINFSAPNGNSIGSYWCGSVSPEDTAPVAKFLVECFGELLEVNSEEEFEKIHEIIFAQNCSVYLSMKTFIDAYLKLGLTHEQARKIAVNTYKGVVESFSGEHKDIIVNRIFEYKNVLAEGLAIMEDLGIAQTLRKVHELPPEKAQEQLAKARQAQRAENAKYRVHYSNWD